MITVVDPWHWLAEDGSFLDDPRMRAQALRVAQCIEAGGPLRRGQTRETLIPCRRRPGRQPCPGLLWVLKQNDDAIHSFCTVCRADEYMIYNWEDTIWADGPMDAVDVAEMAAEAGVPIPKREPGPRDVDVLLERGLALVRSPLTPIQVRRIVERSPDPSTMVREVLGGAAASPSPDAIERLLPVLMELWNSTPRVDLGGRSPEVLYRPQPPAARARSVGRNDPCPCGSGRKYKKCCLLNAPN